LATDPTSLREGLGMERLKVVEKGVVDSTPTFYNNENLHLLEDFKAVVRNLTVNALKVLNRIAAAEMSKPEPQTELVEDYYLLFHYLDFLRRFVSSKT